MSNEQQYSPPRSAYAILAGSLHNRADVIATAPSTIRLITPLVGDPQTFMVQTYRAEEGDFIFIEYLDSAGPIRLALPPIVAARIAHQRDSLTTRGRKRRAKAEAQRRKAAGIQPAFLTAKKPAKRSKPGA